MSAVQTILTGSGFGSEENVLLQFDRIVTEPDEPLKGALESILAQNRIGGVSIGKGVVRLSCGGTGGIVMRSDGTIEVKPLPMGKKRGNRG